MGAESAPPPAAYDPKLASSLAALAQALEQKGDRSQTRSATCQIKPQVTWPVLGDSDFDIDLFFEEY